MAQYFLFIVALVLVSKTYCRNQVPSNVSPDVWNPVLAGERLTVMVELRDTPETTRITDKTLDEIRHVVGTFDTRTSRSSEGSRHLLELLHTLKGTAADMMRPLTEVLQEIGHPFSILWSVKLLHIPDITFPVLLEIAGKKTVTWIRLEKVFPLPKPPFLSPSPGPPPAKNTTWNLNLINARCDGLPCLGRGVLVGSLDTGALWNHVELKDNWVGPPFGWFDGFEDVVSPYPIDNGGHGTHTLGTSVGKTVGVAPEAKWTACRTGNWNLPESAVLKCGQYMCAPWEWDDKTENDTMNPTARPHVINNSYGDFGGSQLTDPTKNPYYKMIEIWSALGILHSFSMGNNGPACGSGGSPATFDISLAVGAVDNTTTPASFSSRGPTVMAKDFNENSTAKGSCIIPSLSEECLGKDIQGKQIVQLIKPDISAPGVNVNSSWNTGPEYYIELSGTSMASPHVTGTIALMICANPGPHWNQMLAYEILTETADSIRLDLKGEGDSSKSPGAYPYLKSSHALCNVVGAGICDGYPNNIYGYGLTDACAAAKLAAIKTQVINRNEQCSAFINPNGITRC